MHSDVPTPESLLEHREWLRALARSLVADANAADDVEQRAWLRVLRNRRPITSARGWLRRVVRGEVVDMHRAASRRRCHEENAARPERLAPQRLVELADAQHCVAAAVKGLPEPYRSTVLLRYFEELSVEDVASRMGCPVETARTRLRRAHALLREDLDREFGGRAAWPAALVALTRPRPALPAATVGVAMAAKGWVMAATTLVVITGLWAVTRSTAPSGAVPQRGAAPEAADARPGRAGRAASSDAAQVPPDTADAAAPRARVAVRIRADDGLPLQEATVVAWPGDDAGSVAGERRGSDAGIEVATTGPDGIARLPAAAVARRAVVAAPGRPLVVTSVPVGDAGCDVTLSGSASVRGLVRVDGAPPAEEIWLTLARADGASFAPTGLPAAVAARLDRGRGWPWRVPARVDASGAFAFAGIEEGTAVQVVLPDEGYVQRGQTRQSPDFQSLAVRTPAFDVFLDLLRLPRVTGRLLDHGGVPLAGARVVLDTVTEDMGNAVVGGAAGADGRFVISAPSFALKSMSLIVSRGDGSGRRTLPISSVGGLTSRELGDIEIATVHEAALVVRDARGGPVADAVAVDADADVVSDHPTDADGRATVHVTSDRTRLRVGAVGYLPCEVETAMDNPSVAVVLTRTTVLEVVLRGPQTAGEFVLLLEGDGALCESANGEFDPVVPWGAHSKLTRTASSEGRSSFQIAQRQDGSFLVSGLRPAVSARLRLFDRSGAPLAEREVVLAAQERRRLEIEVPSPRVLRVRVLGEDGRAAADAMVEVVAEGPAALMRSVGFDSSVDNAGWAVVDDLRCERARVTVRCPGRPCWRRTGVEVPAAGRELDARLEKARTLRVEVRGALAEPEFVYAFRTAEQGEPLLLSSIAERDETGRWTIGDCPVGPVVVHVRLEGGADHRFPVGEGAEAVVTLPNR